MILSDIDIRMALKKKPLIISPTPEEVDIDSTTIDLRIGDRFLRGDDNLVRQAGVSVTLNLDHFKYKDFSQPYLKEVAKEHNGQFINAVSAGSSRLRFSIMAPFLSLSLRARHDSAN